MSDRNMSVTGFPDWNQTFNSSHTNVNSKWFNTDSLTVSNAYIRPSTAAKMENTEVTWFV